MKCYSIKFDLLIKNAHVFTMDEYFSAYDQVSLGIKNKKIIWIGEDNQDCVAKNVLDARGALVTPGLIDCHTHLIYAGHRGRDFVARLEGKTYAEIAREGGGILSTVKATQSASQAKLLEYAYKRANIMLIK